MNQPIAFEIKNGRAVGIATWNLKETSRLLRGVQLNASSPRADVTKEALTGGEPGKGAFHVIDSIQIHLGAVVSATLMRGQPEPARDVGMTGAGAAQMNQSGQILLLSKRRKGFPPMPDRAGHGTVKHRRRKFDRMAGQDAAVQAVEPAGMQIVPAAFLYHPMVVDAVVGPFLECRIGDLEHAHRT